MTTYNKLQAIANWLEAAVVDARSTKAAPLDPSNDDVEGLVRTIREWASAEAMGRSISLDATDFTASIVREAQAVRAERAAAARDDEAFRAQAEAPGFHYNPETDYRLASDLEIVEHLGADAAADGIEDLATIGAEELERRARPGWGEATLDADEALDDVNPSIR